MPIRAFLVDDEPPARARLRQLLCEAGDVLVVGEAGDPAEARAALASARPDVIFLDIEMPEERGTDLAASLGEPKPLVVFATAFDRYALDAFSLQATDYLLKPVTRARLADTLSRIRERMAARADLKELTVASSIQARLLPRAFPAIPGFDGAAVTLPARAVGGDFYLAQALGDSRYCFALGDVAGKGVPAGLVAASLQARLESLARGASGQLAAIVADVNRTLCDSIGSERFATLVFLELDAATGAIGFVNAGHPAMILSRSDGSHETLPSTGPALGLIPDGRFAAESVTLRPGDRLVAYSDGLTEAVNERDEELGDASLIDHIQRLSSMRNDALCQSLLELARAHGGHAPAADDMTLLVIRKTGEERQP